MRKIYFHEDDYCQLEIVPIQNYCFCKDEIDRINNFSDDHKADGLGWTDVYARKGNPIALEEIRISLDDFCNLLQRVSSKYDEVTSDYGMNCSNIVAFGNEIEVVVFVDYNCDTNIIRNIWLTLDVADQQQKESAKRILEAISELSDLLIVDWGWGFLTELKNVPAIEEYLSKRITVFQKYK